MRRWLTSRYDFTGISRLFYQSWKIEVGAILLVALLTGAGFWWFGSSQGDIGIYDGPGAFLPSHAVHLFDWAMAAVLAALLLGNCARMWWFTIGRERDRQSIPLSSYWRRLWELPVHFMTQKRYRECERKTPWAVHLVLMLSYLTLLILIMFFLKYMQQGPEIVWGAHIFGYLASLGLIGATLYAVHGRLKKSETHYKHSHETDWIFLVLLIYVAGTGVAQHLLHRLDLPLAANVTYLLHLMGVVPMLVLEVPFSKWAHMAYRPLAMYFSSLQAEAIRARAQDAAGVPLPHNA
jgi:hypothetical protein